MWTEFEYSNNDLQTLKKQHVSHLSCEDYARAGDVQVHQIFHGDCLAMHLVASSACPVCHGNLASVGWYELHNGRFTELTYSESAACDKILQPIRPRTRPTAGLFRLMTLATMTTTMSCSA